MFSVAKLLHRVADFLEREPGVDERWCSIVRGPCWKGRCEHYVHILGKHPQKDETVDQFDCAIKWLPMFMVDVAGQVRELGAATESWRNEIVRGDERMRRTLAAVALHTNGNLPQIKGDLNANHDTSERAIGDDRRADAPDRDLERDGDDSSVD